MKMVSEVVYQAVADYEGNNEGELKNLSGGGMTFHD
jgi:hypothetical protein